MTPDESAALQLASRPTILVVLESFLMALINGIALFGNLLVCYCVARSRRLRTIPNTFVVALAISDICMVSVPMPLTVGVLAAGYDIYGAFPCGLQGFSILTFGLNSLQTMALIAVNRYVCICRSSKHKSLYTTKLTLTYICTTWTIALFASIPPFFIDWGHYRFYAGRATCFFPFEVSIGYTVFLGGPYVSLAFAIIAVCYYKVYRTVKHSNTIFIAANQSRLKANVEEAKITKTLVVVLVGYLACWTPICLIDYVDVGFGKSTFPRRVYIMYMFLLYGSSSINPFIYGVMNTSFRREYRRATSEIFGCCFGFLNNKTESTTSTDSSKKESHTTGSRRETLTLQNISSNASCVIENTQEKEAVYVT